MRVGTTILTACVLAVPLTAQNTAPAASERDTAAKAAAAPIPKEASSVTDHTIRIGSQLVPLSRDRGDAAAEERQGRDDRVALLYGLHAHRGGGPEPATPRFH